MILVDTGPLVALSDTSDPLNSLAITHLERLRRRGLVTCMPALVEACFHLPDRHQRERLRAFLNEFEVSAIGLADERDFWGEIFAWLEKYADHAPDFAEACIAVLCGQDKKLKVWTYDREFASIWRRPDGTNIPLAIHD